MIKIMQGVFYWGMKISRKEIDLLWNELSLNDYSYLREHYMFENDGYIESIYPGEEPVDIFRAIMSAYDTTNLKKRFLWTHNEGENLNE